MGHDCAFLTDLLPTDRVAVGESERDEHAADWGGERAGMAVRPDAVVYPESTDEVSQVLAACDQRGVPVTPYAAGTALEGHAVPVERGVSMDLTRMDAVLDVRPADHQIDVQPGVIGTAVDDAVERHGLFFPPLPSSGSLSTVGGMIATDASGMGTVKYGEVGDWVLELEAVLADGRVVTAGATAKKTSSGYNLADLLVGSEGTLAVVTRATLELAGRPEQVRGGRAVFPDLASAAEAAADAVRSGVDLAKIELVDATAARIANDYLETPLPETPMLFVAFHADHGVEQEVDFCESIFESHALERFDRADRARMGDLWAAREELGFALQEYDPDRNELQPGDVTVPISAYPDIVAYASERSAEADLTTPCFGHAGDGNLHYSVLVDRDDPDELERGRTVYADVIDRALELGGTATGEHGVGLGKRKYLEREHGAATVDAMRAIKDALDPNGTLNPGKVFLDA
ncbi:MAG: FAD-binding oxidoreductase [Haloarculaceae archaeon]